MPPTNSAQRFFIVGAPKCGTTSVAQWLSGHPDVFMAPVKEPHFFSTDLNNATVSSPASYQALFNRATPEHRAVGEASTWYLASEVAVPSILRDFPEARFIVMTRDPIEMAGSLHHHNLRVLHEDEPDFAKAWGLQEDRRSGKQIPMDCVEPMFLQYGRACSLGHHLDRLLASVAPERVLHIPLAGLKTDPGVHYRRVLSFLGCEDDGRSDFPKANSARGTRSLSLQRALRIGAKTRLALGIHRGLGLGRLNERKKEKTELESSLRSKLDAYFAEDRALLKTVLDRLPNDQAGT